jgi:hypothetical protein
LLSWIQRYPHHVIRHDAVRVYKRDLDYQDLVCWIGYGAQPSGEPGRQNDEFSKRYGRYLKKVTIQAPSPLKKSLLLIWPLIQCLVQCLYNLVIGELLPDIA